MNGVIIVLLKIFTTAFKQHQLNTSFVAVAPDDLAKQGATAQTA